MGRRGGGRGWRQVADDSGEGWNDEQEMEREGKDVDDVRESEREREKQKIKKRWLSFAQSKWDS
ncbi:unnamed protein product [Sphenostylis stenocarpa]|uniref:Uncharacterized protein n=1 Tax=Sphenostylis stenocarpa TaxID=92480 RepID=A0AA86V3D9_9FABA|nr:unnamed protein product [Sphenostylis stenocarpa]